MNLEIHNFTQNEIENKFFEEIVKKTLDIERVKGDIEISLAIVGDGRIRKLNKMYRGKNRVTDVLSFDNKSVLPYLKKAFPRINKEREEFVLPPDGVKRLGEIIICYPRAKKQAKAQGHSLEKELRALMIHGVLHLLGYDHQNEPQEKDMVNLQKKVEKALL